MAVHIRLRRIGKRPRKKPYFRISIFDQRRGRDSKFIEEIGSYDPTTDAVKLNKVRYDSWIKNGAQPTATLKRLVKKINKGG